MRTLEWFRSLNLKNAVGCFQISNAIASPVPIESAAAVGPQLNIRIMALGSTNRIFVHTDQSDKCKQEANRSILNKMQEWLWGTLGNFWDCWSNTSDWYPLPTFSLSTSSTRQVHTLWISIGSGQHHISLQARVLKMFIAWPESTRKRYRQQDTWTSVNHNARSRNCVLNSSIQTYRDISKHAEPASLAAKGPSALDPSSGCPASDAKKLKIGRSQVSRQPATWKLDGRWH